MDHPRTGHTPLVKVIIPHYGDDRLLHECLGSLQKIPEIQDFAHDVIIIDNNKQNIYFTRAVNKGIEAVLPENPDYIWVLNNDTYPEPDYLTHTLERFAKSPGAGLIGGKNLAQENPDQIIWAGSVRCLPAGIHKQGFVSNGDFSKATQEPWLTFSSVVIKREVIEKIGLLDPELLLLASDSDYSFRARLVGFECWYEPRSVIRHHTGMSTQAPPNEHIMKIYKHDILYFFKKWREKINATSLDDFDESMSRYIDEQLSKQTLMTKKQDF